MPYSLNCRLKEFSEVRNGWQRPSNSKYTLFGGYAGRTRRVCCVYYMPRGRHVSAQENYLPFSTTGELARQ